MPDETAVIQLFSAKITNQVIAFGHAEFIQTDTHETILQALNRWMKYDNGLEIFLDTEAFQDTGPAWDKSPLIFAQEHPEDFDLVEEDLEAALLTVKDYKDRPGSICGTLAETNVVIPGQPRLTSRVTFDDPEVQELYRQGKLSLSTGFTCNVGDDGHLTQKVRPNHVLVFVQDDTIQPRDKAAMFLNTERKRKEENMDVTNVGRVISDKNQSRLKQALDLLTNLFNEMTGSASGDDPKKCKDQDAQVETQNQDQGDDEMAADAELKNQIDAATKTITAKDAEIVNRDNEIKALKDKNLELANTVAAAEQAKKDAAWTELKNTLSPGLIDKDKNTIAGFTCEMAEKDPMAFANKIAALKMKAPTQEEGIEHPSNPQGKDQTATNRGIGVFNAVTKKYED